MQMFGEVKPKVKTGNAKEIIAKLSRGVMLPVAILPIAGLFLGLGATIANLSGDNSFLSTFGQIFKTPGDVIFGSLPILFAIAVAISFTKDSGTAGLSALVAWLVFNAIQSAFIHSYHADVYFLWYHFSFTQYEAIFSSNIGIASLNTSVFGGIAVGGVVAYLYNRFKNIRLPSIIGFFSGVRFIPIVTFIAMLFMGIIFSMVWPLIGMGLFYFGTYLSYAPMGMNSFVFGVMERSLVPFGLHHAFYAPLWYTSAGGQFSLNSGIYCDGSLLVPLDTTWATLLISAGKIDPDWLALHHSIAGDQNLWMFVRNTLCGDYHVGDTNFSVTLSNYYRYLNGTYVSGNPGQYQQGKYSFMMFGLPAAAVAMIFVVPKQTENRKQAISIIGSAALTSLLTGITEPLEFTFLFLAPWLFWGIHAPLCGISFWLMNLLGVHIGMTFSGGLLDFVIYGLLPDVTGQASHCYWVIVVGVALIPLYYFLFKTLILKFDIKTPGRETVVKLFTKSDFKAKNESQQTQAQTALPKDKYSLLADEVVKAYGGFENIKNVDACITKLRIQVADPAKVDQKELMRLGARGVIKPSPQSVYAVFGNEADIIKNKINEKIEVKNE